LIEAVERGDKKTNVAKTFDIPFRTKIKPFATYNNKLATGFRQKYNTPIPFPLPSIHFFAIS